jgi:hypothetical protein
MSSTVNAHQFGLSYENGHLILDLEGSRYLMDTGSPTSIGAARQLMIGDQTYRLADELMGVDAAEISRLAEVSFVGLIGMDIMGEWCVEYDCQKGVAMFGGSAPNASPEGVPIESFMGIPIVQVLIGDRVLRMFWDTGAQYSYVDNEHRPSKGAYVGRFRDFYPGMGGFEVDLYSVDFVVGDDVFLGLKCGVLPDAIQPLLNMAGCQGILGNQTLITNRTVCDAKRSRLILNDK